MVEYNQVNIKLSISQLNKLKCAAKNQTGDVYNLPHKLLLITRQTTKQGNGVQNKKISTDSRLAKYLI